MTTETTEARSIEVLFTPADFEALSRLELGGTTCVVFDVLRATSSMITALTNGAESIVPVATIAEAVECQRRDNDVLLAGERDGLRITSALTGSIGFDLGNSPREFIPQAVHGKRIAMTTTNGTRALRACIGADRVYVASFLNMDATSRHILNAPPGRLVIVCSGTFEEAAYEDVLGAGALCEKVWHEYQPRKVADSAMMALNLYLAVKADLCGALGRARNGKRLLSRPELADDVAFCARADTMSITAAMGADGEVRRI